MGAPLPHLSFDRFHRRLTIALDDPPSSEVAEKLFAHYEELRRWNERLSLIGPGTTDSAVEVHYAESLEGRQLLRASDRTLVDLGSGSGFPGVPLAAAVPELEVWLVEPQSRKWAFLRSAVAAAGLSCHCVDSRVETVLPADFPSPIDVLTVRALKLEPSAWASIADVQRFLGLEPHIEQPRILRQEMRPLSEAISNYAAVASRVADSPWSEYLDP